MCMEDIRIGRNGKSTEQVVDVGVASVELVLSNKKRTCLVISRPTTAYITISFRDVAVLDQGINIYPTGNPFKLNIQHDGSMVTRRITAIGSAGNQYIGVWEESVEED